jgi:hypothetical protein
MEKKTKDFDCVEMKRRGAERVHRETSALTPEEELAYWQRGTEELRGQQESLRINGGPVPSYSRPEQLGNLT